MRASVALLDALTTNPDGFDRVVLRVAPWVDFGNLSPQLDTIWSSDLSPAFAQGVAQAAAH